MCISLAVSCIVLLLHPEMLKWQLLLCKTLLPQKPLILYLVCRKKYRVGFKKSSEELAPTGKAIYEKHLKMNTCVI